MTRLFKLRRRSTKEWASWWQHRSINWKDHYLVTWNHPHRIIILKILSQLGWKSLYEVGCGPGPNLVLIVKNLEDKQVGGCDINPDAIALARETFHGGVFMVGPAMDIMASDNFADVVLTDMCLIYLDHKNIGKALKEIKRISTRYVLFFEFHTEHWYDRIKLLWTSGLHAYDYKKLLEKHGFYDIVLKKMPPEAWPEGAGAQRSYGHFILAKTPKRK